MQISAKYTPLGPGSRGAVRLACDEGLKAHILRTVTSLSADGASKERRAVFLAGRELFPNLLIVICDPARDIRVASQALHCDDVFGEVWGELLNDRHALVPDLMNSDKWHNLLVAIQEENSRAVAVPGMPALPLARAFFSARAPPGRALAQQCGAALLQKRLPSICAVAGNS